MSRSRQGVLLSRYSELPSRYTRRVTRTSCQSTASSVAQSERVRETSAKPTGLRVSLPLKITSAISSPRSDLADCSPSAQRTASSTLDLPQPFGPTIAVIPWWKLKIVLSANDLKPRSSIDCKCMCRPQSRTLEVNIETFWGLQAKFAQFEVVGAATQHMILCLDQGSKPRIPPPKLLQNPKLPTLNLAIPSCFREFADKEK